MALYKQNFSLSDIFNNKSIRKKLPIGDFNEIEKNKRVSKNGQLRIIGNQIKSLSSAAASKYYNKVRVTRTNRTITIKGDLNVSYGKAYNGIYNYIKSKSGLLSSLALNNEILQTAWMEEKKNSKPTKLYLKVANIKEIKSMNANQLKSLMNDIIDNIRFSGNYPKAQKLFGEKQDGDFMKQKQIWMKKVGYKNE